MTQATPSRSDLRLQRSFLALLAISFLVFLTLLGYTFRRHPSSVMSTGTGPKANVAIWFGSDVVPLFYLGLRLVIPALSLWVLATCIPSTRTLAGRGTAWSRFRGGRPHQHSRGSRA